MLSNAYARGVDVRSWIDRYGRAWRDRDADAAAEIFTEDAIYRAHPFRAPHVGRDAIRAYWRDATATQRRIDLRFGEPVVAGSKAAVEWWAVIDEEREGEVTLPGCLLLRFREDGRCEELREYWHLEPGRREPPDGWGR